LRHRGAGQLIGGTAAAPLSPPPGAAADRRRVYLDHASTVPLRPEARDALVAWLDQTGDPSRMHAEGLAARYAVEQARTQVAELLGARNREVCFTSGATEAIAAACWGGAARGAHQVVPAIEHSAVRTAAARHGEVTLVAPDRLGRVDPEAVLAAIRPDTGLVHLQWGNHEVGTLQPVAEVVAGCRERGVLVHVDAAQAAGHLPIDFRSLGADLLSVSAHKLGGPAGVGALLIRQGLRIRPLLVGGDQERARRAGYENVPALVGFGAACAALAGSDALATEAALERRLTDRVLAALPSEPALAGLTVYGDPVERLPHLICLGVEGIEPQAVLLGLDRAGIAAHSGSACASESLEPSPVLEAMGVDAHHSLRISTGWSSTDDDVDRLLAALPAVLAELRALDPSGRHSG
jgi:cysteine desulfurase